MVNFALLMRVQEIIRIHDVTQANTASSLVILAFSLPAVLFGPIAGVMADRFNRKHVMFATNILRAVAMLLFLVSDLNGMSRRFWLRPMQSRSFSVLRASSSRQHRVQ